MNFPDKFAAALATLDMKGMRVLIVDEIVGRAIEAVEGLKLALEEVCPFVESFCETERQWEELDARRDETFSKQPPYRPQQLPSSYG